MKRIVVLGAGESGAGAAVLAKKEGFDVFVSDASAIKDRYKQLLDSHGIAWEEGRHTEDMILNADEIIKSPGIPAEAPMVSKAVERFWRDNDIAVEFHTKITPEIIREKEVYLILNSQYDLGLIELVRRARELNYKVGRDISIISYNESPINEIILNGLTTISTDFRQMGILVARMILDKAPAKIKCDFQMIRRNTF